MGPPVVDIQKVSKGYGGLRPLRIASLVVAEGERVSIGGIDAGGAELLVNLITGASLADSGEVRVFGQLTSEIANGDAWLDSLDRFGIVSPRGVMLEGATLLQNLAMPFTLTIDPVPADVEQTVRSLAARCGIDRDRWLNIVAGELTADVRLRAHLARALALGPRILLIEHPTAEVDLSARQSLAADIARACDEASVTAIVLTNDEPFAKIVAPKNLRLDGATGALKTIGKGWLTW